MSAAAIILNQLIIMAIYIAVGYCLHKTKLVSTEGCGAFSVFLLYIILPCVIINSFNQPADPEITASMLNSLWISVVLVVISMAISWLLLRKNAVDVFSSSFSAAGFVGIPLIVAFLDENAVSYTAAFTALLNILQWTYGQHILSKESRWSFREILINPLVISFALGIALYFSQIRLPQQITSCIKTIAGCNAPVAMIILGFYLCEVPFAEIFTEPKAYLVSLTRLIVVPMISLFLLKFIPCNVNVKTALLIVASAPVGLNVAIYAHRLKKDYPRAVIDTCLSTILCVITLPVIIWLSTFIL